MTAFAGRSCFDMRAGLADRGHSVMTGSATGRNSSVIHSRIFERCRAAMTRLARCGRFHVVAGTARRERPIVAAVAAGRRSLEAPVDMATLAWCCAMCPAQWIARDVVIELPRRQCLSATARDADAERACNQHECDQRQPHYRGPSRLLPEELGACCHERSHSSADRPSSRKGRIAANQLDQMRRQRQTASMESDAQMKMETTIMKSPGS
jgi:hypothetical protein